VCRHLASPVLDDSFLPAVRHVTVHDNWNKSEGRRLTRRSMKIHEFQQLKVGAVVTEDNDGLCFALFQCCNVLSVFVSKHER